MIFIYGVLSAHTQSLCLFYIKSFALQKYLCASVLTFLPSVLSSGIFAKNRWCNELVHRTDPPISNYFYCKGGLGNLCIHPVKVNYFQRETCATKRPWQYSLFKL